MPTKLNKRGRPKLKIDAQQVATLARIQCTMKEIAAVVGCSVKTLERNYVDVIKENQENGKSSLRRAQWKSALGGNVGMMIWLGKQHLGQKEPTQAYTGDVAIYDGADKSSKALLESVLVRREARLSQKGVDSGDNGNGSGRNAV